MNKYSNKVDYRIVLYEDFHKEFENIISHYFEREFYGLGENNRTFNHKIYKDIVRRDEEDNEDRK